MGGRLTDRRGGGRTCKEKFRPRFACLPSLLLLTTSPSSWQGRTKLDDRQDGNGFESAQLAQEGPHLACVASSFSSRVVELCMSAPSSLRERVSSVLVVLIRRHHVPDFQARPNPTMSRLSRLGGLTSRRKVDSLLSPTTMTDPAEDDDDPFSLPVSSRSLGASLRPLKQIRRQSRSFSSAFTALFPPSSPSPSTPASGTATPLSSRSPASPLTPFITVRPRLTSEKKKKTGGRRGKRNDGIKRRISYPLLSRASCDQPDRVVVRESWGTRDETQKSPTPCTLGHLAPLPITSNYESCMDQSGSPVVPEWTTMTTTTTTFVPQVPARASLATSTQAVHHDAHPGDLAGEDSASRFSASTAEESIYSTATDSSATWVKFPSTMTVSATAEAPSIVHFAGLAGDESTDLAYSPSLVLDVQSSGENGDEILTAPSSPDFRCEPPPKTTTKIFAPASAPATLAWTSRDSRTENALQSTATPKRQRHPHRLLTPPPTPHLVPVRSRLHTPENLEISPPKYTGLVSSTAAHSHDDAPGGGSTRDSLLSLTLAELSDEMAHIRRRAHSTKR